MAAGDFTASVWPDVQVKALEMWENPRIRQKYTQGVEAARGFIENQQVRFQDVLTASGECLGVKATWLVDCDTSVIEDGTTAWDCAIDGEQVESDSQLYESNESFYREFQVDDTDCDNMFTYEDKLAQQLLNETAKMDQALNKKVIAFLAAQAEATAYTDGLATVNGTVNEIEENLWNEDLLGEFELHARINDISNPYMVSGTNFFVGNYLAQFNALNDDQRDQLAKYGALSNWYFDPKNVDSELSAKATFMVDPGAAGFFDSVGTTSLQPEPIGDKDNTMKWIVPSRVLRKPDGSAVRYEIHAVHSCARKGSTLGKVTNLRIMFNGGIVASPVACSIHSGILQFNKVSST